jgi:glycerol-3-phosphate dehydrogenase
MPTSKNKNQNKSNPTKTASKSTSAVSLRANVEAIRDRAHASVLIIGGGINGIATFRDLALQGVDVVLVERGDYASGASAASSHMIHGGIRYLENGELRLVRESVTERNGLLKIAPHYVKPLRTTIPISATFSGLFAAPLRILTHKQRSTRERGALLIKVGLTMYDWFSRDGGTVPRHEFHGRKKSLEQIPHLNPRFAYTATYFDASVHEPERLALDVLGDGLATGDKARSANYVEAIGVDGGDIRVRDTVSGTEFTISADVVINATGPWTDITNETLGIDSAFMGGTKGSHIVVDNPTLLEATAGRELFFENDDGRIVLIYPLKARVLIGTTDLPADARETAVCTKEEIDYFIELVSHVFPTIPVVREDIVYSYSGIRPLPRHEDTQPGFVSRDYRIVEGELGDAEHRVTLLSLVGGKWTTFRALAERLSTEATTALGVERRVSTAGIPIGGGKGFPTTVSARTTWIAAHADGIDSASVSILLDRYGTRASDVIDFVLENDSEPLREDDQLSTGEIAYFAEFEHVVHLADVVLRRTNLAFVGGVTTPLLAEIATELARTLGWSVEQQAAEIDATITELELLHGMTLDRRFVLAHAGRE